jgi:hypothetical protein
LPATRQQLRVQKVYYISLYSGEEIKMSSASRPPRVRKNMDMDARKLAEAQRVLGARSETEAIDMALDYVLFQGEVFSALDRLATLGGLDDPFEYRPRRAGVERKVAER